MYQQAFYSAFERIVATKTKDLKLHFVCAGDFNSPVNRERLQSIILEGMKKYRIQSIMVTTLFMRRGNLVTKEKMINYCKGIMLEKESFNDHLESFFKDIQRGETFFLFHRERPNETVYTYFLPKLTEEELDLIERKDHNFMLTFLKDMDADVSKTEMEVSESDSKFVRGWCQRDTFTLKIPISNLAGYVGISMFVIASVIVNLYSNR